jgi:DNA invertase Pin-like site-specific DNA recombinase
VARGRFVAYYRVSTDRQGRSGLGLEAQRAAVEAYLNGGRWELVEAFTEVESGMANDRPELRRALAACRLHRATLVVAKLDRLSRNAAFLLTLRDSGVKFVAVDMPEADSTTVGILAVVAQRERETISRRTSEALAAAKARGRRLGTPGNLTPAARAKGPAASAQVRSARARARLADLAPILADIRAAGATSARQITAALNARGIPAARGGPWQISSVQALLKLEEANR